MKGYKLKSFAFQLPILLILSVATSAAYSEILYFDGFESGDLSHTESGFTWGSRTRTEVSTNNPKDGQYSLQMTQNGVVSGRDSWSEQRMALNKPFKEIWMKYDIFIPSNFVHRQDRPGNNKFLDFWAEPYNPSSFYVNWSTKSNGEGGSDLEVHKAYDGSELPIQIPDTARDFITQSDLGKWHEIIAYIRVPTGNGTYDGVIKLWKNGKSIVNYTNVNNWGGVGKNHFDALYILGWANSGYSEDTIFYIDNVTLSDSMVGMNPPEAPVAD